MKVLVTGGTGFIGTHLSEFLLRNKYEVRVLDIARPKNKNIEFVEGDVMDSEAVDKAVEGVDFVIHLAAIVGVRDADENPQKTLEVNIIGTRYVLDACRKFNIKKIIYPSSSEVYGQQEKFPISEDRQLQPKSPYGMSKVLCEELIKTFCEKYKIDYSILRFFNAYGPGQRVDFVLPKFVSLALQNKPLTVYGDGSQVRSFCFIDDIVHGIFLSLIKDTNDIYNIGNDKEPITMKELASKIISVLNSKSELVLVPLSQSDRTEEREIFKRIPDTRKAREKVGYEPKVSLEEGILNIAEFMRSGMI